MDRRTFLATATGTGIVAATAGCLGGKTNKITYSTNVEATGEDRVKVYVEGTYKRDAGFLGESKFSHAEFRVAVEPEAGSTVEETFHAYNDPPAGSADFSGDVFVEGSPESAVEAGSLSVELVSVDTEFSWGSGAGG